MDWFLYDIGLRHERVRKSMDWFLYDTGLRHERVKVYFVSMKSYVSLQIRKHWSSSYVKSH